MLRSQEKDYGQAELNNMLIKNSVLNNISKAGTFT